MTSRYIPILFVLGLQLLIAPTTSCIWKNKPRAITFAECEEVGGVAWRVDLDHRDICPSCAEYSSMRNRVQRLS